MLFRSLYKGEPGCYEWVADFAELEEARWMGKTYAFYQGWDYVENLEG